MYIGRVFTNKLELKNKTPTIKPTFEHSIKDSGQNTPAEVNTSEIA